MATGQLLLSALCAAAFIAVGAVFLFRGYAPELALPKQYGLARCSIHQSRHTNTTLLMANGIDAKSLLGHLGHTNISTADKSLDFLSEKEDEAADTMVSLFEPTL